MNEVLVKQTLCLSCMKCCQIMLFPVVSDLNKKNVEFYEARGFKLVPLPYFRLTGVIADIKCPHLTEKGCDIYKSRPDACREYDGRRDPILKKECAWNELSKMSIFDVSEKEKEEK